LKKEYLETKKKILLDMNKNKSILIKYIEFTVKLLLFQTTKYRANINLRLDK
jgi:hypothetical protein